jgi:hypothetical protein
LQLFFLCTSLEFRCEHFETFFFCFFFFFACFQSADKHVTPNVAISETQDKSHINLPTSRDCGKVFTYGGGGAINLRENKDETKKKLGVIFFFPPVRFFFPAGFFPFFFSQQFFFFSCVDFFFNFFSRPVFFFLFFFFNKQRGYSNSCGCLPQWWATADGFEQLRPNIFWARAGQLCSPATPG